MQQQELRRIHENLTEEHQKYRDLYMEAPVAYFTLNETGNILELNQAAADMLATPLHVFRYTSLIPYLEETSRIGFSRFIRRVFESGTVEYGDLTFLNSRREPVYAHLWADVTLSAVLSETFSRYYVGILTDITEQITARSTIEQLNTHLETALRSGNMAWWKLELPSGKVTFSEHKATILGYRPEDFTHYTDFMDLVHPDDYNPTMDAFRRHLDGSKEVYSCEYRIRNADGGYLWFRDLGKVTGRESGVITLTGIVTEITEIKKNQETMERFRTAMDNSSDQVFLIDRKAMKFMDVNNTACFALDYTREELLSLGPHDIKPDYSLQDLTDELDKVLSKPSEVRSIETKHRSKSGRLIPVEVRLRAFETPGNSYIIAIARDMTQHKQAKEELEAANRRFLTILQHINVGILVITRHNQEILYANPYIQSFYPEPLEHRLCSQTFGYKEDLCPICPVFSDSEEEGKGENYFLTSEYHLPEIDKWFLRQISPIRWVDSQEATLLILTDITALKEVEQLKDDIGRITRHDLKNPLNGILGGAQLLLMDDEDLTEDQKRFIGMIETSGKRMLNMIDESLGLYKMERGLYEVQHEQVNLDKLLDSILDEHRSLIDELKINVHLERKPSSEEADGSFIVRAEQLLCYSTFSNIIKNALDASSRNDSLRISFEADGDRMVHVSVWNRKTIPREVRGSFGRKYSTWGKTRGTGLGVYSARLMTEVQGGKLTWETSKAEGTTLRISLPAFPVTGS